MATSVDSRIHGRCWHTSCREIDFVAERGSEKIYIQVAYLIATEEIRNREFGNLLKINDNFPKYVISANPMIGGGNNKDGIRHMSLRQFLKTRI